MNRSTSGDTFTSIAKGLHDLERVIAHIHAKNCGIKDFVKVLGVSQCFMKDIDDMLINFELILQAFGKLGRGMVKLADESESFKSKMIFGLLRGVPDLFSNVKHIQEMFKPIMDEEGASRYLAILLF